MKDKSKSEPAASAALPPRDTEREEIQTQDAGQLIEMLKRIEQQIEDHKHLNKGKKKFFLKEIRYALESYDGIEVPSYLLEQYRSMLKGGNELLTELRRSNQFTALEGKIAYYLRYVIASGYDFRGELKPLRRYARSMMIAAAGFMLLTPQFYGYILPLIFIVPIFIGLRGLRKRSRTALYMTMAVLPMAILASLTYISWTLRAVLPDYAGTLAQICATYHVSETLGHIWLIGFGVIAPVVLICSIIACYYGIKYYRMYL